MKNLITNFINNESGATAIEYGLIAAGIGGAIILVVSQIGTSLSDLFSGITFG